MWEEVNVLEMYTAYPVIETNESVVFISPATDLK